MPDYYSLLAVPCSTHTPPHPFPLSYDIFDRSTNSRDSWIVHLRVHQSWDTRCNCCTPGAQPPNSLPWSNISNFLTLIWCLENIKTCNLEPLLKLLLVRTRLYSDKLYWVSDRDHPKDIKNAFYFCIDDVRDTDIGRCSSMNHSIWILGRWIWARRGSMCQNCRNCWQMSSIGPPTFIIIRPLGRRKLPTLPTSCVPIR